MKATYRRLHAESIDILEIKILVQRDEYRNGISATVADTIIGVSLSLLFPVLGIFTCTGRAYLLLS